MKNLTIQITNEQHQAIKVEAANKAISIKQLILDALGIK